MHRQKIAKLAVSAATYAIDRPYSYLIPSVLEPDLDVGVRVTVPFGRGNRRCEGIVLEVTDPGDDTSKLKSVVSVLDASPVITREQLKLALWMRDRFFCSVYDAVHAMLPAGMWFKEGSARVTDKTAKRAVLAVDPEDALSAAGTKEKRAPMQSSVLRILAQIGSAPVAEIRYFTGASQQTIGALAKSGFLTIEEYEVFRRPDYTPADVDTDYALNDEQLAAYDGLVQQFDSGKASAALLYGVTGSGKTPVYIKLIELVLSRGRTAMVLVPEIALTPQLMGVFLAHFGDDVAVLHSSLGVGERYDEWKRIKTGRVHVVVGTRSAVFAPLADLGLIVMDEEQEHTYKSESSPRYHARDVAKYICAHSGALLLMGSATPSVESMYSARSGAYSLYRLSARFNERELPRVMIADMRSELKRGNAGNISSVLAGELEKNIDAGEQSILLINRRGASSLIACGECGFTYTCPRCSVSMTYHSANRRLMCHYCGHSQPVEELCPECAGRLKFIGAGTQKVEEELNALFPGIEIVRMDADTVSAVGSHEKLLTEFKKGGAPILLGTQMVAKGLDFENVTLVGVISADRMLYMNDYRAHERAFSLLTQVVGRSGRGAKPGRAVIQTFTPENEIIRMASSQDYDSFYEREMRFRELSGSPPVSDIFMITASSVDETAAMRACAKMKSSLMGYLDDIKDEVRILGPAPAPVLKLNNRYRYRVSLACKNTKRIRDTIAHVIRLASSDRLCRGVSIFADSDPAE